MDELHRAVAPFIHSSGGGLPGGSMGHGGGGSAPFDVGFFAGNENADPADMGAAEQHQNIARREWDELRSSREWRSVENHFARCDRKIDAIFEKARSMYRDGHLALDIEDESDIKRGLDAYFSDLHDFPSNGHRFRRLKLVAGLLASLSDSCASRGEPASSGVAFHPKHTTAIAECSLKPVHSREKPVQGLARAVEEDDYLKPLFQAGTGDVDSTESAYAKQRGLKASRWWQDGGLMLILNKVLLLPSLTSKGKGVKLNASLAHSERISALAEVEKGEEGTSRLREEALREQGASLPLSERPIEREAVNQLSGLGLLVSEGCFGKAYERLSFDGRSVAGREELIPRLIHVQASFNNTIVTVTNVRGRVVYWASAGTCGFRGTRRGTPFATQTAAGNVIRTVVEQGTQRAEVMKKGPGLEIPSSKVRSHKARRPFDDPTFDVIPFCSLPVEYPNYSISNSGMDHERFCLEMPIRNSQL
ncbi:ribosomal protein S11, chloroplastic [Tanacetum coccineum]